MWRLSLIIILSNVFITNSHAEDDSATKATKLIEKDGWKCGKVIYASEREGYRANTKHFEVTCLEKLTDSSGNIRKYIVSITDGGRTIISPVAKID